MKTKNNMLILDNEFSWKYLGKLMLILIIFIIGFTMFVWLSNIVLDAIFSSLSGEQIVTSSSINLVPVVIIFGVILFIELMIVSLPKMSMGQYRLDADNLYVQEKFLFSTIIDDYIPLRSITKVNYNKDIFRYLSFPYKHIEIEIDGEKCRLYCLKHQEELYDKLQKAIAQNQ